MANRRFLDGGVPEDIYRAQVDAMFVDFRSLWVGALAAALTALCVSFESSNAEFAIIALALTLVGLLRCFVMSKYSRPGSVARSADALRRWEIVYVAGAALHVGLLGAFCIVAFTKGGDTFARVTSLTVAAFFLIGIPGRNFASNLLVNVLLLTAGALIFIALSVGGGYYWFLGFLVVLPSFLTMRKISLRLRGVYLDALLKARDVSVLADRFDTALNNMPHGLAMLDNDGRVVVTNQRLLDLLKLQPRFSDTKATIEELLHHSAEAGGVCKDEISEVVDGLHLRIGGEAFEELLLQTTNGRTLDLTLQPMPNGGAVVLFEDVTERKITQARINELARFDSLTGLPNRTEFHERAEDILSSAPSSSCAIMFVDL